MNTSFTFLAYCIYLPVTLTLTHFVAKMLFKNSRVFMLDIFNGREEIADATNHLFKVGFYLLNMGFALLLLKIDSTIHTGQFLLEVLSLKTGGFSIYLGVMLFLNLYLLFRGKRKSRESQAKITKTVITQP